MTDYERETFTEKVQNFCENIDREDLIKWCELKENQLPKKLEAFDNLMDRIIRIKNEIGQAEIVISVIRTKLKTQN